MDHQVVGGGPGFFDGVGVAGGVDAVGEEDGGKAEGGVEPEACASKTEVADGVGAEVGAGAWGIAAAAVEAGAVGAAGAGANEGKHFLGGQERGEFAADGLNEGDAEGEDRGGVAEEAGVATGAGLGDGPGVFIVDLGVDKAAAEGDMFGGGGVFGELWLALGKEAGGGDAEAEGGDDHGVHELVEGRFGAGLETGAEEEVAKVAIGWGKAFAGFGCSEAFGAAGLGGDAEGEGAIDGAVFEEGGIEGAVAIEAGAVGGQEVEGDIGGWGIGEAGEEGAEGFVAAEDARLLEASEGKGGDGFGDGGQVKEGEGGDVLGIGVEGEAAMGAEAAARGGEVSGGGGGAGGGAEVFDDLFGGVLERDGGGRHGLGVAALRGMFLGF